VCPYITSNLRQPHTIMQTAGQAVGTVRLPSSRQLARKSNHGSAGGAGVNHVAKALPRPTTPIRGVRGLAGWRLITAMGVEALSHAERRCRSRRGPDPRSYIRHTPIGREDHAQGFRRRNGGTGECRRTTWLDSTAGSDSKGAGGGLGRETSCYSRRRSRVRPMIVLRLASAEHATGRGSGQAIGSKQVVDEIP